ncbi:hypothetical protein WBP07_31850 [Novosphingobium sp. BL-8A]|uniref:hypothetical protein n=1 Tax=Novosphingobium sp. BL-8A TaxID=3127639 RepID=UPI003756CE56
MRISRILRSVGAVALGIGLLSKATGVWADAPSSPGAVPGWTEFLDGVRDLPDRILAKLPPEQRDDPQVRQEVGRLALSAVTAAGIDALASDPDHPAFVPQLNNYLTVGQPNADTNYRSAKIAPGGVYRLRGVRGSMNQVRVAEAGPPKSGGEGRTQPRPVHDINALHTDEQGRFDVILSPTRPEGYTGDWWQSDPATNMLLVRMVGSDWEHKKEPSLSIERVDRPAPRPRPNADKLEAALRGIPASAGFIAPLLVDRPGKLRAEGYVNKLKAVDLTQLGGLAGQFYFEGAYALKKDEALLIETAVPAKCTYHSLILTNDIYETTDWYNNQSSLNGGQSSIDSDGTLRVVVSGKDPGVPNWLDTAGYDTGVIQGRWMECSSQPIPTVRKVALSELPKLLPKGTPHITPEQRDAQIRARRATLQQRPLW